jgi:hypothetical protein
MTNGGFARDLDSTLQGVVYLIAPPRKRATPKNAKEIFCDLGVLLWQDGNLKPP